MKAIVYTIVLLSAGFLSNSAFVNACEVDEFQCSDGCCIPNTYLNDDHCDCGLCEDEDKWDCNTCNDGCPEYGDCGEYTMCLTGEEPSPPSPCSYAGSIPRGVTDFGTSCNGMTNEELNQKLDAKCNEVYPGSRIISYGDIVYDGYKNITNLPSTPIYWFQPSNPEYANRGRSESGSGSRLCYTSSSSWADVSRWSSCGSSTTGVMCVYGECPNNKPDNTCTHGILGTGSNSDVCCSDRCSQCGGIGCGTWPFGWSNGCCYSGVKATQKYCDETYPPCVIRTDKPEETSKVEDYFNGTWTGTCENPSSTGSYETCCDKTCGVCGGTGCRSKDNLLDGSNDFA